VATWESFRNALTAAAQGAVGDAAGDQISVRWEDEDQEFALNTLLLSIVSTIPVHDRDVETENMSGLLDLSYSAMRDVTIQFRSESVFDSEPLGSMTLLEKLRSGLRLLAVREALLAAEIVVVDFPGPTTRVTYEVDGRRIASHQLDVTFRTLLDRTDPTELSVIETVNVNAPNAYTDEQGNTTAHVASITAPAP